MFLDRIRVDIFVKLVDACKRKLLEEVFHHILESIWCIDEAEIPNFNAEGFKSGQKDVFYFLASSIFTFQSYCKRLRVLKARPAFNPSNTYSI